MKKLRPDHEFLACGLGHSNVLENLGLVYTEVETVGMRQILAFTLLEFTTPPSACFLCVPTSPDLSVSFLTGFTHDIEWHWPLSLWHVSHRSTLKLLPSATLVPVDPGRPVPPRTHLLQVDLCQDLSSARLPSDPEWQCPSFLHICLILASF